MLHGGAPLCADSHLLKAHTHVLDLRHAAVARRTVFALPDGESLSIRSSRFVSLCSLHLMCMRFVVEAARDCEIQIRAAIDGDVWDLNGPHLLDFTGAENDGVLTLSARCSERGTPVAVSELTVATTAWTFLKADTCVIREAVVRLQAHLPFVLDRIISVHTGLDSADPGRGRQGRLSSRRRGWNRCAFCRTLRAVGKAMGSSGRADTRRRQGTAGLAIQHVPYHVGGTHTLRHGLHSGARPFQSGLQGRRFLGHRDIHAAVLPFDNAGSWREASFATAYGRWTVPGERPLNMAIAARSTPGRARRPETMHAPFST